MSCIALLFIPFLCPITAVSARPLDLRASDTHSAQVSVFERKLQARVERFDTSGRTLVASVLDLAYEYELPMGLEYIDHDAVTRPIDLDLRGESVRGILVALVQQASEYRVSFSDGLVDIYSPKARDARSNLLNMVIKNFSVSSLDTRRADVELVCALAHQLVPPGGCGGSIAPGQWGQVKITLHMENARIYEVLNAIVAQNGKAVWFVMAPPEQLSKFPMGGLWHIDPLQPPFKAGVLDKLTDIGNEAGRETKE